MEYMWYARVAAEVIGWLAIACIAIVVLVAVPKGICDEIKERKLEEKGRTDPGIDLQEILKIEGELVKEKEDYERGQTWREEKLKLLRVNFRKKFPHVDESVLRVHNSPR